MKCTKCGQELDEGATFCGNCGQSVGVSENIVLENVAPSPTPEATAQPLNNLEAPINNLGAVPPVQNIVAPAPTVMPVNTIPQNTNNDNFNNMAPTGLVYPNPTAPQVVGSGLAIASLVLGILGVIGSLIPIIGFVLGILAIIFGSIRLKSSRKGFAIAGLILGSIAVLLSLFFFVLGFQAIMNKKSTTGGSATDQVNSDGILIPAGYKRVGKKDFGYFNVPGDYSENKSDATKSLVMYNDNKSALTVSTFEKSRPFDSFVGFMIADIKKKGGDPIQTSATLDGKNATHLSAEVGNEKIDVYLLEEPSYFKFISFEYGNTDTGTALVSGDVIYSYHLEK